MGTFRIDCAQIGPDAFVLAVVGEADLHTAPQLDEKLDGIVDRGARRVLVDLMATSFMDSTTLGVLLRYQKRIIGGGGALVLVSDDPRVLRTFEITGLDRTFSIERTLSEGVTRLVGVAA